MKVTAASLLLPLLLPPSIPLAAQQTIAVGDRVRIIAPRFVTKAPVVVIVGPDERRLEGVLVARDSTTLSVRVEGEAEPVVVALASIKYLDVHHGHDVSAGNSAFIGFGVGASLGVIIGLADGSDPQGSLFGLSAGSKAALLGIVLGGAGAALGALVGAASNTGTWESVPLTGGRLSAAPILGGFDRHGNAEIGLRVHLTF